MTEYEYLMEKSAFARGLGAAARAAATKPTAILGGLTPLEGAIAASVGGGTGLVGKELWDAYKAQKKSPDGKTYLGPGGTKPTSATQKKPAGPNLAAIHDIRGPKDWRQLAPAAAQQGYTVAKDVNLPGMGQRDVVLPDNVKRLIQQYMQQQQTTKKPAGPDPSLLA